MSWLLFANSFTFGFLATKAIRRGDVESGFLAGVLCIGMLMYFIVGSTS